MKMRGAYPAQLTVDDDVENCIGILGCVVNINEDPLKWSHFIENNFILKASDFFSFDEMERILTYGERPFDYLTFVFTLKKLIKNAYYRQENLDINFNALLPVLRAEIIARETNRFLESETLNNAAKRECFEVCLQDYNKYWNERKTRVALIKNRFATVLDTKIHDGMVAEIDICLSNNTASVNPLLNSVPLDLLKLWKTAIDDDCNNPRSDYRKTFPMFRKQETTKKRRIMKSELTDSVNHQMNKIDNFGIMLDTLNHYPYGYVPDRQLNYFDVKLQAGTIGTNTARSDNSISMFSADVQLCPSRYNIITMNIRNNMRVVVASTETRRHFLNEYISCRNVSVMDYPNNSHSVGILDANHLLSTSNYSVPTVCNRMDTRGYSLNSFDTERLDGFQRVQGLLREISSSSIAHDVSSN